MLVDLKELYKIDTLWKNAGHNIVYTETQSESSEYYGLLAKTAQNSFLFRKAKITPTKVGQFVTLWKRPAPGAEIAPIDAADGIAFIIVLVSESKNIGLFIFSQKVLTEQDIFSVHSQNGKRAFRVYPPWVTVDSAQAKRTQKWQAPYYLDLSSLTITAAVAHLKKLTRNTE